MRGIFSGLHSNLTPQSEPNSLIWLKSKDHPCSVTSQVPSSSPASVPEALALLGSLTWTQCPLRKGMWGRAATPSRGLPHIETHCLWTQGTDSQQLLAIHRHWGSMGRLVPGHPPPMGGLGVSVGVKLFCTSHW